jgi:hypothetical protein
MALRHLETSLHQHRQSRLLIRPEGRFWVLRAIRLFKTSLNWLRPSRFIRCPRYTKWIRMAFRHLETSLEKRKMKTMNSSSFFFHDVQKTDYALLGPFAYLKHHLSDMVKIAFFDSRDAENDFACLRHLETSLHLIHKSRFLRRSEGRLWVLRAFRLLKKILKRLQKVTFFDSRNADNNFVWPIPTLKNRFIDFVEVVL